MPDIKYIYYAFFGTFIFPAVWVGGEFDFLKSNNSSYRLYIYFCYLIVISSRTTGICKLTRTSSSLTYYLARAHQYFPSPLCARPFFLSYYSRTQNRQPGPRGNTDGMHTP
jgi:hypothetical protein